MFVGLNLTPNIDTRKEEIGEAMDHLCFHLRWQLILGLLSSVLEEEQKEDLMEMSDYRSVLGNFI